MLPESRLSSASRAGWMLGLAVVYVAVARLGLALDPVGGFAALVWPPTGIALAALLRLGRWLWPAVAAGAFVANVWSGAPWLVATGIALGNTLEAVLGAWLLRRLAGDGGALQRVRDAFGLLAAALVSPLASASIGVFSLTLGGVVAAGHAAEVFSAWWLGDVLGDLVVAPVLLTWTMGDRIRPTRARAGEALALTLATLGSAVLSFSGDPAAPLQRPHMVFPALVWAAIRFGPKASALAVAAVSLIAIGFSVAGVGPFVAETLAQSLTALQEFMGAAALTSIFLAAASQERSRAERELAEQHAVLQEAVQARDAFLSLAGHELKTPLTALWLQVTGLQRALRAKAATTEASARELQRVDRAVGQVARLARLVEDLLDVSRITAGRLKLQPASIDLAAVVREVVMGQQEQAAQSACTLSLVAPAPVTGTWDRVRIEQVVANLVTNALQYGGGKPVEVSVEAGESSAVVHVRDHGVGIAPEQVERIFERFERGPVDQHRKRLGVGLYIARQIVDAHGGTLRVESTPGAGSDFVVELPRVRNSSASV